MSTRATYSFKQRYTPTTVVYIHYDGYLKGAASYFYAMLMKPSRGGYATQFIRANGQAELTTSHRDHSDTEYRYDLEVIDGEPILRAYERVWGGEEKKWCTVFDGSLYEFVNTYGVEMVEEFSPFVRVEFEHGTRWLNETMAKAVLEEEHKYASALPTLRGWAQSGVVSRRSANYQSVAERILSLTNAFPALMTDEIAELTTM